MSNPLYNLLGTSKEFGNMANFMKQFNAFKQAFNGDPQAEVQRMIDSGQITQEQFNEVANMATQIQKAMK